MRRNIERESVRVCVCVTERFRPVQYSAAEYTQQQHNLNNILRKMKISVDCIVPVALEGTVLEGAPRGTKLEAGAVRLSVFVLVFNFPEAAVELAFNAAICME